MLSREDLSEQAPSASEKLVVSSSDPLASL